jgi:tetratricopeptide (TPR) repeat protein
VRIAPVLTLQAQLSFEAHDLAAAKATAAQAWALQREHLPLGHLERAQGAFAVLLDVAHAERDFASAIALGREAVLEAVARGDDLGAAYAESGIAWALRESGDLDAAEELFAGLSTHPTGDAVVLAYGLAGLGGVDLARGRFVTALARLREAEVAVRRLGEGHEPTLAEIREHISVAERGAANAAKIRHATGSKSRP